MRGKAVPAIILAALTALAWGIEPARAESVPFSSGRWEIRGNSRLEPYLGNESLYLKGGIAWLKDVDLLDGIIEFDIAVPDERGFMGAVWRLQDRGNYEEFYIRPHQSGNPDANQYTPVFNGLAAWQLYYGEGYAAPVTYRFNAWMHVRIVFAGGRGEVYLDSDEPILEIRAMKREIRSGRVGVVCADFTWARFANFSYTPADLSALRGRPVAAAATPAGTVEAWLVSGELDERSLDGKSFLTASDTKDLRWDRVPTESTGILNLASVRRLAKGADTVFTRLVIRSDRAQVKRLSFGYSDRVRAWFNGRLIYGGSHLYQLRDYRYLGTIGLFDDLYLPLREGDNELWLAVSERSGGWGVLGRFEDMKGIELVGLPAPPPAPRPADP
jgi:hypothetical protein